jgi:hypothetical protein
MNAATCPRDFFSGTNGLDTPPLTPDESTARNARALPDSQLATIIRAGEAALFNPAEHPVEIEDRVLRCPRCRSEYLHQTAVSIWRQDCHSLRSGSPGDRIDTGFDPAEAATVSFVGAAAFPRGCGRQLIDIAFTCESCARDVPARLRIAQGKGQTFLTWVAP